MVVIAPGCFHQLQEKRTWVESDIQSKKNLRYSINQLLDKIADPLCKAVLFYHAFTGFDYTLHSTEKGR